MNPFEPDYIKPCPKCTANGWVYEYVEAGSVDSYGAPGGYDYHWPDHLTVTCRRCGYTFDMETSDAKVSA